MYVATTGQGLDWWIISASFPALRIHISCGPMLFDTWNAPAARQF